MQRITRSLGFSLLEMLIALSLGLVVIAAAVQLYSRGLNATYLVSQRAQMQQDVRAAQNLLTKDISLAGAGLPTGGVGLATGTALSPRYGCDQANCYINNGNGVVFPGRYLYPILPGRGMGATLNAGQGATDVITVAYADNQFLLQCYDVAFLNVAGAAWNPRQVRFTLKNPLPPSCAPPVVPHPPQAVNDPAVGLQVGDLVLFQNNLAAGTGQAVGEVTNVAGNGPYTVTFADPDRLAVNQTLATGGDIRQIVTGAQTTAVRIWLITYYLDILANPSGAGAGTPRLMRQVNGRAPVPVADNVADLRFTYDTYDDTGNLRTNLADGGASLGIPPSMIRKVNITRLTARSALQGKGYQGIAIQTEVSVRNMSFKNRYQ